jgi:copper chaperone CopZ
MNRFLPRVALAAMLLVLTAAALRADGAAPPANADQTAHATFVISNVGSADDVDKITTALKAVKGVTDVSGLTADSKRATITYTPSQASVQQLAQTVASVPGKTDSPFQASLLVHVENLSDSATQEKATGAVKKVAGVSDASMVDATAGTLRTQFAPLADADKAGSPKGATQDQILQALKDAGLTASTDVPPAAAAP